MLGIRRPDEGGIGDVQLPPEHLELRRELVAVDLGVDAGLGGSLLHFLTMFIEAGEKKHLASAQTPVACQHVGGYGGVGVTDMRDIVNVVNRGGDVKGVLVRHIEGKIPGWKRLFLGGDSGGNKPERLAQAKEGCFQRHLYVQVSRGLLFGAFDVIQEGQESINIRSLGVSS